MNKAFYLIESHNKLVCDNIKKEVLIEDWLNYVAFIFENKQKNIKYAYFSNTTWGEEYSNNLHEIDPVRSVCKGSSSRIVIWDRLALSNKQKDFMNYRREKCSINQAITLNLSSGDEFKLLTIAGPVSSVVLEEYIEGKMKNILDLSGKYTFLFNAITSLP